MAKQASWSTVPLTSYWILRSLVVMCLIPPILCSQTKSRSIPDDNLAIPVLITIGNTTGSGFFVNTPAATYLVTAKHVLFDPIRRILIDSTFTLTSYSKDLSDL